MKPQRPVCCQSRLRRSPESGGVVCAVPKSLMREIGARPGDRVWLQVRLHSVTVSIRLLGLRPAEGRSSTRLRRIRVRRGECDLGRDFRVARQTRRRSYRDTRPRDGRAVGRAGLVLVVGSGSAPNNAGTGTPKLPASA